VSDAVAVCRKFKWEQKEWREKVKRCKSKLESKKITIWVNSDYIADTYANK